MASRANVSRARGAGQSRSRVGISRVGFSRSRAVISVYTSGQGGTGISGARVFHNGLNVTPQSLLTSSTAGKAEKRGTTTTGDAPVKRPSAAAGGGVPPRKKSSQSSGALQSAAATAAARAGEGARGNKSPGRRMREGPADGTGLTEEDLNAPISIELRETPTMMLLEIRGSVIATDMRLFGRYQQEKQEYEKRSQERAGSDRYASRHTQTVNWAPKTKEVMAATTSTKDASCAATTWDIFDEQCKGKDQGPADDGVYGGASSKTEVDGEETAVQRQASELATVTLASNGCLLETANTVAPPPLPQEVTAEARRGGGIGGSTISMNQVNPHSSRARGTSGTSVFGGGGHGGGGRKGNPATVTRKNSQSSTGTAGTAAGGWGSKLNIDGGELATEEEAECPMDARGVAEVLAAQQAEKIMVSKELLGSLELVERSLFQNLLHSKQLQYRNHPPVEGPSMDALLGTGGSALASSGDTSIGGGGRPGNRGNETWENVSTSTKTSAKGAALELLWTYRYPFPGGDADSAPAEGGTGNTPTPLASVATAIAVIAGRAKVQADNRAPRNAGVEVGGVGVTNGTGARGAAAASTASDAIPRDLTVTALRFHQHNGDVLAVGYGVFFFSPSAQRGGAVLFWSVRNSEYPERSIRTRSGVTSLDFSERHPNLLAVGMYDGTIAIYDIARKAEVKWINNGAERAKTLVSISTDGRVVEWSMKKGLSFSPLMVLKRIGNTEGVISRQASGLSFDFPPGDGATYFTGTEEGVVNKCSVSYTEQYLETYHGHTGPVYRVRCSPFSDRIFLSCSADWTVRLWEERHTTPLLTLRSVDLWDAVNDVAWSPTCATVLASVTGDGRVQLWNLAQSTLDPIASKDLDWAGRDGSNGSGHESACNGVIASVDGTGAISGQTPRSKEIPDGRSELSNGLSGSPLPTKSQPKPPTAVGNSGELGQTLFAGGSGINLSGLRARGTQLTAVAFAAGAPVLAVGDNRGCVDVYKIVGLDLMPEATREEQVERLHKALKKNVDD